MHDIVIRRPDDFHVHLREGRMLERVVPLTAQSFARALVMPNLSARPIVTADDLDWYQAEICRWTQGTGFKPLMTLMLTADTTPSIIREAKALGCIAVKYYPKGMTTNSEHGVEDLFEQDKVLSTIESERLVLCLHGEQIGAFCLDREMAFLTTLERLAARYPKLRIVMEHITTADAVNRVKQLPVTVAATITVHHLSLTLDDVIGGFCRPHYFCKPIPKRDRDRRALLKAAFSGNGKFFLGTDSAPHTVQAKESACGCAGVFTAPVALPFLCELFRRVNKVRRLGPFVSEFGAQFYELPLNEELVTYERTAWIVPKRYMESSSIGMFDVVPFLAGETLDYQLKKK